MVNSRNTIRQQTEESSTPVTVDAETAIGSNSLYLGNQITLPTKYPFYKITAVEQDNGATVAGNFVAGVCMVDSDPPVATPLLIIAYTPLTAQAGTDVVQKTNVQSSLLVGGGAKLTGFYMQDGVTGVISYDTISSANVNKAAYTCKSPPEPLEEATAWSAGTAHLYLKIYYRGYG